MKPFRGEKRKKKKSKISFRSGRGGAERKGSGRGGYSGVDGKGRGELWERVDRRRALA